jgi:hypothetical protein
MAYTYATWNPSDKAAGITLSGGDLVAYNSIEGAYRGVRATQGKASEKWYWEIAITNDTGGGHVALANASAVLTSVFGGDVNSYRWQPNGYSYYNGANKLYGFTYTDADIFMFAVDMDAGKIWVGKNGVWQGDPVAGTGACYSGLTGILFPSWQGFNLDTVTAYFGASAFAYSVPAGFNSGVYKDLDASISEDATSDDTFAADAYVSRDISEDASVHADFNDNIGDFDESATAHDEFDVPNIDGIDETATSDDAISVTGTFNTELYEEFLTHAEILGTVYYEITLADGFATTDSQIPGLIYYKTNDDTFLLVDESTGSIVKIGSISDGFMIYDTPRPDWQKTILDTFDAADLSTKILGFVNPDSLTATDTPVSIWHGVEQLSETPFIYDSNVYAQYLKSIADTFAATDTVNLLLTLSISDWLTLRDSLNSKEFISLSETFNLADDPTRWWDKSIAESLVSTDSITELGSFGLAISDAFTIADAITRNYLIRDTIADTFALADTQDIHSHLYSTLADSLDLSILITLTGDTYECWVLNTPKFYPSVYSGFNFNSYATFNGRAYGANSTGIYELVGTTDAGTAIKTGVVLPKSLLGIPTAKRLLKAKLGVTGTTPVLILEVENGTRKTFPISTFKIADGNRDVKGREWTVSVTDFDTLDSISLTPQVLPR